MAYTSAAVEALRVHGIPARYVEDYYLADTAESDPLRLRLKFRYVYIALARC